jgi:hypothetical protein
MPRAASVYGPRVFSLVVVSLLLGQTTAEPLSMVATPFTLSGVDAAVGAAWQERFVSRLRTERLKVTTAQDVQQLLGLERQRALLGCSSSEGSCLAELAGALGVSLVLSGNVVKSESGFVASIRVLRARDGQVLASPSERVTSESALLDWLDATALAVQRQLIPPPPLNPVVRWVPAFIGVGLLAGSATCLGLANARYQSLVGTMPPPLGEVSGVRVEGETLMGVGIGLGVGGAVAVLSSVLWAALAPAEPPALQVSVWPTRDGAFIGFSRSWP